MPAAAIPQSAYYLAVAYNAAQLDAFIGAIKSTKAQTLLLRDLADRMLPYFQIAQQLHFDDGIPMLPAEKPSTVGEALDRKWDIARPDVQPPETCTEMELLGASHFSAREFKSIIQALATATECGYIPAEVGRQLVSLYQKLLHIRMICDYHRVPSADVMMTRQELIRWAQQELAKVSS